MLLEGLGEVVIGFQEFGEGEQPGVVVGHLLAQVREFVSQIVRPGLQVVQVGADGVQPLRGVVLNLRVRPGVPQRADGQGQRFGVVPIGVDERREGEEGAREAVAVHFKLADNGLGVIDQGLPVPFIGLLLGRGQGRAGQKPGFQLVHGFERGRDVGVLKRLGIGGDDRVNVDVRLGREQFGEQLVRDGSDRSADLRAARLQGIGHGRHARLERCRHRGCFLVDDGVILGQFLREHLARALDFPLRVKNRVLQVIIGDDGFRAVRKDDEVAVVLALRTLVDERLVLRDHGLSLGNPGFALGDARPRFVRRFPALGLGLLSGRDIGVQLGLQLLERFLALEADGLGHGLIGAFQTQQRARADAILGAQALLDGAQFLCLGIGEPLLSIELGVALFQTLEVVGGRPCGLHFLLALLFELFRLPGRFLLRALDGGVTRYGDTGDGRDGQQPGHGRVEGGGKTRRADGCRLQLQVHRLDGERGLAGGHEPGHCQGGRGDARAESRESFHRVPDDAQETVPDLGQRADSRGHRLAIGLRQLLRAHARLSLAAGQCAFQFGQVAHLVPGLGQDALVFRLDLLLLRQAGDRNPQLTGVVFPHLGDILCHARVVHQDGVLVLDAFGRRNHRLLQAVGSLTAKGGSVLEPGDGLHRLVQGIAPGEQVLEAGRGGGRAEESVRQPAHCRLERLRANADAGRDRLQALQAGYIAVVRFDTAFNCADQDAHEARGGGRHGRVGGSSRGAHGFRLSCGFLRGFGHLFLGGGQVFGAHIGCVHALGQPLERGQFLHERGFRLVRGIAALAVRGHSLLPGAGRVLHGGRLHPVLAGQQRQPAFQHIGRGARFVLRINQPVHRANGRFHALHERRRFHVQRKDQFAQFHMRRSLLKVLGADGFRRLRSAGSPRDLRARVQHQQQLVQEVILHELTLGDASGQARSDQALEPPGAAFFAPKAAGSALRAF